MNEAEFIEAICADPDDDAPRLVFSDWLEEHGNIDRAEFIRIQCEIGPAHSSRGDHPLRFREGELRAEHGGRLSRLHLRTTGNKVEQVQGL